jgi:putative oxidoreductase
MPKRKVLIAGASHEGRTDYSMLLGAIFLLCVGAGPWSLDTWLGSREEK